MKKDGIQTRNRKMSAKGKKKKGSMLDMEHSPMDFFKQGFAADNKPSFGSFPSQHYNPAALHPTPGINPYINPAAAASMNGFANSFMTSAHTGGGHTGFGGGLHGNFPLSSMSSMSNSNFNSQSLAGGSLQSQYSGMPSGSNLNL